MLYTSFLFCYHDFVHQIFSSFVDLKCWHITFSLTCLQCWFWLFFSLSALFFILCVCVCVWSMGGGLALFFCIVAQQQMVSPCASSPLVFHFLPACTATHRCVFKEIFHNVLHSHHQGVITSSDTAGDWQSPKLTYFHNSKSKGPDLQYTAADLFSSFWQELFFLLLPVCRYQYWGWKMNAPGPSSIH